MKRSEWIAVGGIVVGLLATTIGSALYLSFKIGGINEKVNSMEVSIVRIQDDIDEMKLDIAKLEVKIGELQVKVDTLWTNQVPKK